MAWVYDWSREQKRDNNSGTFMRAFHSISQDRFVEVNAVYMLTGKRNFAYIKFNKNILILEINNNTFIFMKTYQRHGWDSQLALHVNAWCTIRMLVGLLGA